MSQKHLKSILFLFAAVILTISNVVFAYQEGLSILDAETAAKIETDMNVTIVDDQRFTFNDVTYDVFINENNELDFKQCNPSKDFGEGACAPLRNSYVNSGGDCQTMKTDEDGLPENAILICNGEEDYLMAVYKDENEDIIHVAGRKKNDKEFEIIREIKGKAIIPIKDSCNYCLKKSFVFAVAEDSALFPKKGSALIQIDRRDGGITEYLQPFSLKAKPVIRDGNIFFVGLDQNIYEIKNSLEVGSNKKFVLKLVWENDEKLEVVGIVSRERVSIAVLRDHGKDKYKFFTEDFTCELHTEYDVSILGFVNTDFSHSDESIMLVAKSNGHLPTNFYLMRWYSSVDKQFFKTRPLVAAGPQSYENIEFIQGLLKFIEDGLADHDKKTMDLEPRKICKLKNEILEMVGDIHRPSRLKTQKKLVKDLVKDYSDIEFTKPYSITVKNSNDDTQIPVNVWPAKGASAKNPKPIILYLHGGPNSHLDINKSYYSIMQYLSSQGYWVVCPEARGSTGYGDEHEEALVGNWNNNHIDDVIAVAEALKNQHDVDENNMFLMGSSFGGYTTLAVSTRPDVANYFNGYVAICGLSDVGKAFREVAERKPEDVRQMYLDSWDERIGFAAYRNDYSVVVENAEISPFYHVGNVNRPLLLIHGSNDDVVLPNQSEDFFFKAKKDANKQVAGVIVEGKGHSVGFYSHAVLPLNFFNQIASERCPAILDSNTPVKYVP